MSTVTLHIGAFKTGTSFIQTVLMNSRSTLAELGVLWPGQDWGSIVQGVQGLRGRQKTPIDRWLQLVDEIDAWEGESALLSMEYLSLAKPDAIAAAIDSLSNHQVKIILTMRDIGRAIPAQWQESMQNGQTWSYLEYLSAVTDRRPRRLPAGQHFWLKQDPVKILRAWGQHVPAENLLLVTVPPQGSPSSSLWERFCSAAGLPPERFDATIRVNESLGADSAEVMRYVMTRAAEVDADVDTRKAMKKILAKQILSARKSAEPTLLLPSEHHAWAVKRGKRMVSQLNDLGPSVIGDLDDLVPRFPPPSGKPTANPSAAPVDELLAAAAFGLVGMSEEVARLGGLKGRNRKRRLDPD